MVCVKCYMYTNYYYIIMKYIKIFLLIDLSVNIIYTLLFFKVYRHFFIFTNFIKVDVIYFVV